MDTSEFARPLYINLYNFEDEKFKDNRYVLTSPRSLQACDESKVKPADLLYKPLSEYQDELEGQCSFEQILDRYNNREQRRLEKLYRVRQRRSEIVSEQHSNGSTSEPEPDDDVIDSGNNDEDDVDDDFHVDTNRTKLAVTGRDMKYSTFRDDNENTVSRKFMELDISEIEKADSEKSEKSDSDERRSPALSGGSRRSMTSSQPSLTSWMEREVQSAGRIQDKTLRRHLNGSQLSITSRDERILAAMVRKEEHDRRQEKLRRLAHVAWEETQERAKLRQERQAIERQRRVTDLNKSRDKVKIRMEEDRQKQTEQESRLKQLMNDDKQRRWQKSMENIHDKSIRQLVEKKKEELERKKSQEERKNAREQEMAEFQQRVNQYQMVALERASEKKEAQIKTKAQQVVEKNKSVKQKQAERLARIEKEKKAHEEALLSNMAVRHMKAEENVELIENQRLKQIEERRQASEERVKNSKAVVEHRDKVMDKYYNELSQYKKFREEQADDVHNQTIEKKRVRASEDRVRWSEIQKQNLNKVVESEKARQRDIQDQIDLKTIRSQRVQQSKEQSATQLRTLAYNSQLMRNQLREKYGKDSFDKKAQKVELDVRMGLGGI